MRILSASLVLFIFTFCNTRAQIEIAEAFPNLKFPFPVDIQSPDDGTNRMFVVSQPGVIHVFENNEAASESEIFLDLRSKVLYNGEQGLLGLAFHPDFADSGYFYVDYTTGNPRRTIISRFTVDANDPNKADPGSEFVLLEVEQPYSNHNGGQVAFGPDGYLYVSFGDGGSGGDPDNNGQNLGTLLASIIRIDVDNKDAGLNYSIPDDNPFYSNSPGYREEIYAYGLRNVWRFSFDKEGRLWAGDVGQNAWEEINIIGKGDNCGWNIMEGLHCYNPSSGCNQTGLALPVWEYGHNSTGGRSVTGGHVSYSPNVQELFGKYICADYISGRFWALSYADDSVSVEVIAETGYLVSTFGVDNNDELYFASYTNNGKIYKFVGTPVTTVEEENPEGFGLRQNYPNPFNPTTTIEYILHTPDFGLYSREGKNRGVFVGLKVFDVLGREVATLQNGQQNPGTYTFEFDGSKLSSGLYFYSLSVGQFNSVRKMLLMR